MKNKRLLFLLLLAVGLLLVPLIAMQFDEQIKWSGFDFLIGGILLFGTAFLLEFVFRKVRTLRYRIIFGIAILLALLLVWAELAVGIFGTPFAGT